MDQDATWYGGRPWPRRHCVIDGDPSTPHGKGHSWFMRFPPYLYFRFPHIPASRAAFIAFLQSFAPDIASLDHFDTVAFDVKRRSLMLFALLPKPEVVLNGQMVEDRSIPYIALKSNRKSGTASSFMWFPPYFCFRIGRRR